jgi:predicted dehydrogenase
VVNVSRRQEAARPLRAGVVGAGFFGRLHAQKYANLEGVELVGIADPLIAPAREIAEKTGTSAFADHHALIGKVDCVSIASPATTHAAIAAEFLHAGVHVLVEKPLAVTLPDADELVNLAKGKTLVLQTGHQERYVFAASGLLDRDRRPLSIECHRAGPFTGRGTEVSVALDLMIHDLDLVHALDPAEVTRISATARNRPESYSDEVSAILTLSDGCRVSVFASRMAEVRRRYLRVKYHDGEIEIDLLARTLTNTTKEKITPAFFPSTDGRPGIADDPLGYAVARFVDSVRTGEAPLVRPEEARRALATALAILKSADSPATKDLP